METIKGNVLKVVFNNKESGFKVLKTKIPSGPIITIVGEFGPEIIPGTIANFHGDFKQHSKYGTNFKVSSYTISFNAQKLENIKLFIDNIAPNIGPERAEFIVNYFGENIVDVLDNAPERLMDVPGIGKISTNNLKKAWEKNRNQWDKKQEEYTLRIFLNSIGLKEGRIKKILNYFGGKLIAEEIIKKDPYKLTEIDGFGFTTTDFIARKLGIPETDPMRLKAFILYTLKNLCSSYGHLYLTRNEILDLINKYAQESGTSFIDKKNICITDIDEFITNLEKETLIINDSECIYDKNIYISENNSAKILSAILKKPSDLIVLTKDSVDNHITKFEHEHSIQLSKEQRDALHYFAEKKVFIITGGPGTGKTLITKAIVDLALNLNLNLTCMTPTGISAKKMAETINFEAYTIHRRLGFRGNAWIHGENNKFYTDVIILDEASMIDQETFFRLLLALENRVHIIFVGDDNQLPSVGAGNVLRELINCNEIPIIRLEQIFRQNEASDIIKAAHRIKNGDANLDLFKYDPKADVFFIRENNTDIIENYITKFAQKFKNERKIFQIITARNEGPLSVSELNNSLQNTLNSGSEKEIILKYFKIKRGDRVIIIKNDYELEVYNGEIGKVIDIEDNFISIQIDERIIKITKEEASEKLKLAYSITVHRSQGQEYPYIILPFINQFGRNLLQRNLLYTAITRAKQKVIVIGHGSALEKAINNSSVYKRNTKLSERITIWLHKKKNSSFLTQLGEQVLSLTPTPEKEPF